MQVRMLVQNENAKLRAALVANLKSAVTASFLMLPESFSEEDLFLQMAGLSYAGNSTAQLHKTYTAILYSHVSDAFSSINNTSNISKLVHTHSS